MIWAIVDNRKTKPTPKLNGKCPVCLNKVISKCGEVNDWYWSHLKKDNCDSWFESETIWHKHWKMTFGKENTEIVISIDNKKHIADIQTNKGVIIELQNSPISKFIIKEREEFYGEQMLWLINGVKFKNNLSPKNYWNDKRFEELANDIEKQIKFIMGPRVEKGKNDEFFHWKYPIRSWIDVHRHIFIDFGDDTLFWVKEGMGTKQIRGTYVLKKDFIKKYEGDYKYYFQHRA